MKEGANTTNFQLDQSKVDTFVAGGTLGDMYVIFCKLFDYHRRTGKRVRLIRYSCATELDGAINQLFKLAPYVELEPCRKTSSNDETVVRINDATRNFAFINNIFDGRSGGQRCVSADKTLEGHTVPEYIRMEPFPTIDIPLCDLGADRFHIGVQLHCGSFGRNFRGFSLKWLAKLSRKLKNLKTTIHVLGTGDGYEKSELKQLNRIPNVQNWAGETSFSEWLSLMKSMNTFISLEGFPAFFAMSQKVPTILYDQFIYGIGNSIHPAWRKNNIIIRIPPNMLVRKIRCWEIKYLKKDNLYSPRNLGSIRDFIDKNMFERDS